MTRKEVERLAPLIFAETCASKLAENAQDEDLRARAQGFLTAVRDLKSVWEDGKGVIVLDNRHFMLFEERKAQFIIGIGRAWKNKGPVPEAEFLYATIECLEEIVAGFVGHDSPRARLWIKVLEAAVHTVEFFDPEWLDGKSAQAGVDVANILRGRAA